MGILFLCVTLLYLPCSGVAGLRLFRDVRVFVANEVDRVATVWLGGESCCLIRVSGRARCCCCYCWSGSPKSNDSRARVSVSPPWSMVDTLFRP